MAYLKSLPLSSVSLAAGQIFPLTMLLTFWQYTGVIAIAAMTQELEPSELAAVLLLIPPLNWAAASLDNAVFLLFPHRIAVKDPGNLPFVGRLLLTVMIKGLALALATGIAVGLGVLAGWLSGGSWLVGGIVAAAALTAECVPLTIYAGATFDAFDVARDIPD
jgi:hypothetical protein